MTRLYDVTFEAGTLTGFDGFTSINNTPTLDTSGKIKYNNSCSIPATLAYYGRLSGHSEAEIYLSFYINISAYPASNDRIVYITNTNTGLLRVVLTSAGRLQLQDGGGTNIGSTSSILSTDTIYRIGVRYKQGTGSDGIAELYLATGDAAFGTAVTAITNHVATLVNNRIDIGNTNTGGGVAAFTVDNIHVDTVSMPVADSTASITDNIVAYWNLDEASGNRADSLSVSTLTDNNTVTSASGKISNAAVFTRANSEYLSRADSTILSAGNINISFGLWVKLNSKPADNMSAIGKWNYSGGSREYTIGYDGTADRLYIQVSVDGTNTGATKVNADNLGSPSTGTWYYIFAWHDSGADTLNIQVNNGTVNSSAHSTGIFDGSSDFNLGAMNNGTDLYWDGSIDEVGIWKRILSSTEKTTLYNSGSGKTYPFTAGGSDTPMTVNITVTGSLSSIKQVAKIISIIATVSVSITRAILLVYTIAATITQTLTKNIQKGIMTIATSSSLIQKDILKPVMVIQSTTITLQKDIQKTITAIATAALDVVVGRGYFKTVEIVASTGISLSKNINKVIAIIQGIEVNIQKLLSLSITVSISTPITLSVRKSINITKTFTSMVSVIFSKSTADQFVNVYVKKNVRALTLSLKNSVQALLGKDTRTITVEGIDNDNN